MTRVQLSQSSEFYWTPRPGSDVFPVPLLSPPPPQAHDSPVRAMTWSHNDMWMLTADHGGYVKYWQSNMNNVKMFQAHKEAIREARFIPHLPFSVVHPSRSVLACFSSCVCSTTRSLATVAGHTGMRSHSLAELFLISLVLLLYVPVAVFHTYLYLFLCKENAKKVDFSIFSAVLLNKVMDILKVNTCLHG